MSGGSGDDEWFSLAELTTRLGGLVWIERNLADIMQRWSRSEDDPRAQVLFFETGRHHRWHAERIESCLPTSPVLAAAAAIEAPTPGWKLAVEQLDALREPTRSVVRLLALTRIVDPWLEREAGALTGLANPVSDRTMTRWFRFITIDHDDNHAAMVDLANELQAQTISLTDRALLAAFNLT